jgi:hypothetical protein
MGIRGRRRKRILDNLKEKRGYLKLKREEPLWKTRFGRGHEAVVRQTK